jgi:hypothetical protein
MIIYNETFIVEDTITGEWLNWIRTEHISSVMATGSFDAYHILTVLDSPNEGVTYCIQYTTDSIERYSQFYYHHLPALHERHNQQFENQFVLFHTLMETVE